jgi:hypothetical protein
MAAALAVVAHAPRAARPALESLAFDAFHSGLQVACLAGAGVAVLGALAACRLLPGRGAPEVQPLADAAAGAGAGSGAGSGSDPERYPEFVPYASA